MARNYRNSLYQAASKPSVSFGSFTPATLQPIVYDPGQVDMSLLAKSLDRIGQREEKLSEQQLAIDEAFAKAREALPDNEETNQYITDSQNKVKNSINAVANSGDYAGAITVARRAAGKFISSPEYVARVKEHQSRTDWLQQLEKSNADTYIKDYYKDIYKDKNNFTRDEHGNITGTAGWEAPLPEKSITAQQVIDQVLKTIKPTKTDNANTWSTSNTQVASGGHSSHQRETLLADNISASAKNLVQTDESIRRNFYDQLLAGINKINKLKNELNSATDEISKARITGEIKDYESRFYKNGAPLTKQEYIDSIFDKNNDYIKNAAYDYIHTNTGSNNSTGTPGTGNLTGLDFGDFVGAGADYDDLSVQGDNVHTTSSSSTLLIPQMGQRPRQRNYIAPSLFDKSKLGLKVNNVNLGIQ